MSPRNAPHQTKLSQHRSSRIVLAVHALLIGVVVCAAGAGAVGDPAPRERNASAAVFRAAKRVYQTTALGDTSAPTRPRRLTLANATPTSVTVSWRRSSDNVGVAGYEVYLAGRPTMQTTDTAYTIDSLACNTTFRVGVAAYDTVGFKSGTTWISVATAACAPAPPPLPSTTTTATTPSSATTPCRHPTAVQTAPVIGPGDSKNARASLAGRHGQRGCAPLQRLSGDLGQRWHAGEDRRDDFTELRAHGANVRNCILPRASGTGCGRQQVKPERGNLVSRHHARVRPDSAATSRRYAAAEHAPEPKHRGIDDDKRRTHLDGLDGQRRRRRLQPLSQHRQGMDDAWDELYAPGPHLRYHIHGRRSGL